MIGVGQNVGNYNVTEKIGEGGMGMVFLAEHPVIGAKVALKAIHPDFARDPAVVARFVNEAKAVGQLRHEHIVEITDFGTTEDRDFYFFMEYLRGEKLSDRIVRQGVLPVMRALNIAAQIADALQASHQRGVIHRDLKSDNVFLVSRGRTKDFVKVLDFGLAKLTHEAQPLYNTGAGAILGTAHYMSPEQCEGSAELDHRSDIYSLGIILFEMLTGRLPFPGNSFRDVIVKQLTMQPPAARSLAPDVPASVEAVLNRALAKEPAERFQTMAEFRAALRDPEAYVAAEAPRPRRKRGPVVTLLALTAAAGIIFASPTLQQKGRHLGSAALALTRPVAAPVVAEPAR